MALSVNTIRGYDTDGPITNNEQQVKASSTIYEGSAVGSSAGYARALNAGDSFLGFALAKAVGGSSDGDVKVNVRSAGRVSLNVTSVAVTDINKDVYASDDGTFTLDPNAGTNSLIGKVHRFVSSGVAIVAFNTAA
jgi:predicted RecA/RadA family phage recombinase